MFLVMLVPLSSAAQQGPDARVDAYVRSEMSRRQIPGLSLLVIRDHREVRSAQYGLANIELDAPVTESTSFEIASMTKAFTDAVILRLAEQGRLRLTDRLSQHLPDLPAAWAPITIEQLMNHTSGLRDDWDEADSFFVSQTTGAQFLESLKAAPLRFAPGSDWGYSCGPFVLGLVIERVTGVSYAQFMQDSIFKPLGMNSTRVNDPAGIVHGRASGYVIRHGVLRNGIRISGAAESRADVGIMTTARDLAIWDATLDGGALLSARSRALMFTPARLLNGETTFYGLGWFIAPYRGHTEIEHGGGFRTGFSTVIARYPDDRLTVIVLTNLQGGHAYSIARGVAAFYDPDFEPIPRMSDKPDPDPARTRTVARVLAALGKGESTPELMPGALRFMPWSVEELRDELAHASPPVYVGRQDLSRKQVMVQGNRIVAIGFYRTEGDAPRFWSFGFTPEGRVGYFELEQD